MSDKQMTSLSDRVNFAPSALDEKNILAIVNGRQVGISDAVRCSAHLYADILRLGLLEKILSEVSEAKTIRLLDLQDKYAELEKQSEKMERRE